MDLKHNAYKPISFWSWNSDMNETEIRAQIREFKEKGFGGFFIHSRAGLVTPYMSEAWFEACAVAIDEAEKNGIYAWLYDEDGWPSGFAGGLVNGCGEDYCGKQLRFSIGVPNIENARILAVYRNVEENEYTRIETKQGTEKDLYCFYQIVPHYVDIMDRKIIAKFIKTTHEQYRKHFQAYFGTVVKGIFTDEPQMPEGPCWSLCMEDKYRELYGEDIKNKLWLMYTEGKGYQIFRYRFWHCANELIHQNFVCQIQEWCSKYGLVMTGHFSHEDGLCEQTQANAGVMALYRSMGLPGIDHLGNRFATPVLMKQVSSVAHRRGLQYVLSESFWCAGWDISFKELLGIAGWQAVLGVNLLCTHLSAYTITGRRKRDYPAFFSYQEPWWNNMGELFGAIARLNQVIGSSKRDTKVAVLHPIRSMWCECAEHRIYHMKSLSAQFRELVENLLDIHVDFDLLDESELKNAIVDDGNLQVGQVSYSLIIIPEATTLAENTAKLLLDFEKSHGKFLFVNRKPTSIEGDSEHPLVKNIQDIRVPVLQNTRYILQKYFRAEPIQNEYHLYDLRKENEVSGIVSHYGKIENGAIFFLFNRAQEHDIELLVQHVGSCRIQSVDLVSGEHREVKCIWGDGETYAPVSVEGGTGLLLKLSFDGEMVVDKEIAHMETMGINKAQPTDNNCLTLDMGRFSVDGGEFSPKMAVLHMLDEIYQTIAEKQQDSEVCIEYLFETDFRNMPSNITLAVEKIEQMDIYLNGCQVTNELGWWIDKGIKQYDITNLVQQGTNVVQARYSIKNTGKINDIDGKFESERNRFFYRVEPEAIYICGQFDVKCTDKATNQIMHHQTSPSFVLCDATPKQKGDLTIQNMWFYRGDCEYTGVIEYTGNEEVYITIPNRICSFAEVYVNGNKVGLLILDKDEVRITSYLSEGENDITIIAKGHNRNLMGPHHHIRGDVHFVGPHTFEGVKGFEDFMNADIKDNCTWTDKYAFVPFGIYDIQVIRKKGE